MFDECAYDAGAKQIHMESLTRLAAVLRAHGKTYKLGVLFSHRQPKDKENGEIIKVERRKSFTRTILVESCASITIDGPRRAVAPDERARTAWHAHSVRCLIARTQRLWIYHPRMPHLKPDRRAHGVHQLGLHRERATPGLHQAIGDCVGEVDGLTIRISPVHWRQEWSEATGAGRILP
jgi:hypothetical protein